MNKSKHSLKTDGPEWVENQKMADLTRRETEVAMLAGNGATDKEISSSLRISTATTKNHVKSIYKKLGVHARGAMVAMINQKFNLHESFKNSLKGKTQRKAGEDKSGMNK